MILFQITPQQSTAVESRDVYFTSGNDECDSRPANAHFSDESLQNEARNLKTEKCSSIICLRDMSHYQR